MSALVDWLLAASLALTVLVFAAGIDFRLAGVTVRSHSAGRVFAGAAALFLVRRQFGIAAYAPWVGRVAVLTAVCGSIATWFRFLLTTIGGADSFGYVSASRLIASGNLTDAMPIAEWLSAANRMAIASPLGWAPAPDASGIVPAYPLGVSFVMAAFAVIGGSNAVYYVSPAMALLTLALVYRFARDWFDREVALMAVALTAWHPVFIAYAKQPMSDMAATMWIMLAVVAALAVPATAALKSAAGSALVAGLAAGAAVITRPALLLGAAVVPLISYRPDSRWRRLVLAAAGLGAGVVIQMVLQAQLFGSPMATGYGTTGFFSVSRIPANLVIFVRQFWATLGPVWLAGMIAGWGVTPRELRWRLPAIALPISIPYLLFISFDDWEVLRYLLPGTVPFAAIAAAGVVRMTRSVTRPGLAAALTSGILLLVTLRAESLLRRSSVWEISSLEARYTLAAEWLNVNTPLASVALANQHSGSLRWYGKRQTLRWDFIDPQQLVTTVSELQSHGATVYVALEGREVEMFDTRFADVIGRLQVDHVGRVRNVSFRRLVYLPPNK